MSAKADRERASWGESLVDFGLQQLVIVMSNPIVVYGQGVCVVPLVVVSGSKLMSKGRAEVSVIGKFVRSLSSLVVWLIYPAVARAGWRAVAQLSRMMLCAIFLLQCMHENQ